MGSFLLQETRCKMPRSRVPLSPLRMKQYQDPSMTFHRTLYSRAKQAVISHRSHDQARAVSVATRQMHARTPTDTQPHTQTTLRPYTNITPCITASLPPLQTDASPHQINSKPLLRNDRQVHQTEHFRIKFSPLSNTYRRSQNRATVNSRLLLCLNKLLRHLVYLPGVRGRWRSPVDNSSSL